VVHSLAEPACIEWFKPMDVGFISMLAFTYLYVDPTMEPSVSPDLAVFSPDALVDWQECTAESIYAPPYIQPHGAMFSLEKTQLTILQASENIEAFMGIAVDKLLGQPIQKFFSRAQFKKIVNFLKQETLEQSSAFELKLNQEIVQLAQPKKNLRLKGTLYRTVDALILELKPLAKSQQADPFQYYSRFQEVILGLRSATNLSDLAQTLVREIKAITGFDRVMVYRFEADEHGIVIAEEKEPHLVSYLGLHYPATDIPAHARDLFYRQRVREIPNVNYEPIPLVPPFNPLTNLPTDLSDSMLRGVHPYHVEYLQNMGVAASLTISLPDDTRLWGLIACHHYSPRQIDYETRKTCEFLGQFASIELVHQQERMLNAYRSQVRVIQDELQRVFLRDPNFIEQVLICNRYKLLELVHANGAAILLDGELTLIGQTPTRKQVYNLVEWLEQQPAQERVFATHALSQLYPAAQQFKETASGLLAISIVLSQVRQKSYRILWFRPEQVQTVDWAGNPQDAMKVDDSGELRLCPRKSFELWKETVWEMSYPWQLAELEAATEVRNTLMLAVLEFSQTALEQAAERAAIANRAKSQFLAKMSHELRTPLNAILGFTQVMNRSSNTPSEFQEHLGIINRSGEHLLMLINDVLEMSRIEAGQLVLTESCFDLFRLIHSIQEMFMLKASEKGLRLNIEESPCLPRYLYGDQAKIRQIMINLLSNAIKFTDQGHVILRVKCEDGGLEKDEAEAKQAGQKPFKLCFEVEDTGSGVAAADVESIFEAFMQTESGRSAQGTGLGLSISRQFARLMAGDITVMSAPTGGAIFTCHVTLHLPLSLDIEASRVNCQVLGLEPGQPTYRILVAEDVLENRHLLLTILESAGFEVRGVENGVDAIAQWQAWCPHLIFMDIQMPTMEGYEATRQIRAQEVLTQQSPVPIVALTAYAFDNDRIASLAAGCTEYIAKPFTETAIFEAIARHLEVQYRYREELVQKADLPPQAALTAEDLKLMPAQWLEQAHEAALDLSDSKLRQLIAQIPQEEKHLIGAMNSLVDNFQLDVIVALTQP